METSSRSSVGRWLPWVALVAVWFLWGSTYLAIRVAVGSIPPFIMAGTRYVIAGAILTAFVALWKRDSLKQLDAAAWRAIAVMGFSLLLLGNGLLCYVETTMPSGISSIIIATVPIWMLVIDALFTRKAIGTASWIGLGLGTFGIIALAGAGRGAVPLGSALLLSFSAFSWAAGSVYARKHAHLDNPIVPALEMFVGGWMLLAAGAITGEFAHFHAANITPQSVAGFAWLVTAGAIVGYSAYGYAVRHLPTQVTATYAYVNPIVAVALGTLVLREPLTLNELIGGAAVVLAVIAILKPAPRKVEPLATCDAA
jgi:drug/metabolite transporter (DMT)-like permease